MTRSAARGETVPPTEGEGGSFIEISPALELDTENPKASVEFVTAHEVFHLVQYAYVPSGMPEWVAEGTANMMADAAIGIPTQEVQEWYELWFRQPWVPLTSSKLEYGAVVWWARCFYFDGVLRRYFDRLAQPRARALPALEAAFRSSSGRERSLYLAYANFWEESYRMMTLGGGPALAALPSERVTRVVTLEGLSANFVAFSVPPSASGIRVALDTGTGPPPHVRLFLGDRRRVDAVTTSGGLDSRSGRTLETSARFANAAEQREVVLLVTSGRASRASYRLRFQALPTPP